MSPISDTRGHGREQADAWHLLQCVQPGVGLGQFLYLALEPGNRELLYWTRGDPSLLQQVRAEQVGQGPSVDPVVFQASVGDRFANAEGGPCGPRGPCSSTAPPTTTTRRRLQNDACPRVGAAQHLTQSLWVIGHVPVGELVAALVHDRHLSSTAVDVQTYVEHVMTPFSVRDYQGPSNAGRRPDPHIIRTAGARSSFRRRT
jgi:hypothetical protein